MSVEAIKWALNEAPLSKASHLAVLMALANVANEEGKGAFISQRTMSWQTRKTERAVRNDLKAMEDEGVIRRGNQERVNWIPADRRPIVWDLALNRTRDMSKQPNKQPASGWDGKHRATDDVDRIEPEGTPLPPDAESQVKTGGSGVPGGSTASNRGEAQRRTGGKHTSDNPNTNPNNDTHPRSRESTRPDEPETETGVCVTPEDMNRLKEVLRTNLMHRPTASEQKTIGDGPKIAIRNLAIRCLNAGATCEDIDIALSGAINPGTTHPYTHGTSALEALLARKQGTEDPLGNTKHEDPALGNTWINPEDGQEWPHRRLDERPCRGQHCGDFKEKRYVAVEEQIRDDDHYGSVGALVPVGGAFSCQTCKEAYKKEGLLT